jgi:citrate lyase beta subunit
MSINPRPRRAFLYVPANDLRKTQKSASLGADCVCLDLEDAVSESGKDAARQGALEALSSLDFGRSERWVRVNAPSSQRFTADMRAVAAARPQGILIPKVENADVLKTAAGMLDEVERSSGWQPGSLLLGAIVETPLGVLNLWEICSASPRLAVLVFGAEDYAAALGATRQPDDSEAAWARGALVTHAAAFGLDAIDLVTNEYRDLEAVRASAVRGVALGFRGKQVIHPNQVEVVQQVFTPSTAEIEHAQRLTALYEEQQRSGSGALGLEGVLVDMPVYRQALNVLARAGALKQD